MRTSPMTERLAHRVGTASALNRPADALASGLRRIVPPGPVEDALTGTALGHPLHPVLVGFPIGSWSAATVLDVVRANSDARRMLVGFGVVAALAHRAGRGQRLADHGQASRPQPRLEVQVAAGRVRVRRAEPRSGPSEAPHQG
jgi:hypothetical protein